MTGTSAFGISATLPLPLPQMRSLLSLVIPKGQVPALACHKHDKYQTALFLKQVSVMSELNLKVKHTMVFRRKFPSRKIYKTIQGKFD